MPVIKLYHHGMTAGVPPGVNTHERAKREPSKGWTRSSTRSNTRFLYSVHDSGLTGIGFALSLTLRDCPPGHTDWQKLRRAYFERLRRMGLTRAHWLTEWQRRGVPHLHSAVWFDITPDQVERFRLDLLIHWVEVAKKFGAGFRGQHIAPIHDSLGWFKYLAKHASRGLSHYQRSPESIPAGWERTGRMWGYLGVWPCSDAIELEISPAAWFQFRRMVRRYRISDARTAGSRQRLSQARRMLKCSNLPQSQVRGVSEWIEVDASLRLIHSLAANGYPIRQYPRQSVADGSSD